MERYSAARPRPFVASLPVSAPEVGLPTARSLKPVSVLGRETVSTPLPSSAVIFPPTVPVGNGHKPDTPARYDHLRQRYDERLKRLEQLRRRLHTSPLDEPIPEQRYSTRWREAATIEELLTDIQVRKVAFAKARSLGYTDQDAEDCFQLGSINLWKALQEQPTLLRDKGAAWVGIWIAFSGSRRALWKHAARNIALEHSDGERSHGGNRHSRPERWAAWATRVDERIDFEWLMHRLAQRYDSDPIKLFALYSLTTAVKMKDITAAAGVEKNGMIAARNTVKDDIRQLLELNTETNVGEEFWTDQLERGENVECVRRVAERVQDNQRLLLALYVVTTSVSRKDVTASFNIGLTAFRKDITQIKVMLAQEFRTMKLKTTCQSL